MKQTLLVLFGGSSSEYSVSLKSAAAVLDVIEEAKYSVLKVGITQKGQWLLYEGPTEEIRADRWYTHPSCTPVVLSPSREDHGLWVLEPDGCLKRTVDLAFPVLHGRFGEDGTVQGLLELAGIPIVGCASKACALAIDKAIAHDIATANGIRCPKTAIAYKHEGDLARLATKVQIDMQGTPYPWYVKPADEGSSFGITRVEDGSMLQTALATALRYSEKAVVEEGIAGFEVGCALLGGAQPLAGAVDAISLQGGFFDFHEKYNLETAQILLPAPISADMAAYVQQTAKKLYRLFDCAGFARLDFFVTPQGELVFNEINPIPGLTAHSRYPRMMQAIGIDFAELIARLLKEAQQND